MPRHASALLGSTRGRRTKPCRPEGFEYTLRATAETHPNHSNVCVIPSCHHKFRLVHSKPVNMKTSLIAVCLACVAGVALAASRDVPHVTSSSSGFDIIQVVLQTLELYEHPSSDRVRSETSVSLQMITNSMTSSGQVTHDLNKDPEDKKAYVLVDYAVSIRSSAVYFWGLSGVLLRNLPDPVQRAVRPSRRCHPQSRTSSLLRSRRLLVQPRMRKVNILLRQ